MKNGYLRMTGVIFFVCFMFSLAGCATKAKVKICRIDEQCRAYTIENTQQRLNSPDKYFSKEKKTLQQRREVNQLPAPSENNIVGLAFSGGGIRSNAFQLGLLSGLHHDGYLKNVDYISAVSGGSWAAAAYKASKKADRDLFGDLDKIVLRDDLKVINDKQMRPLFNSYEEALRTIADVKFDVLGTHVGYSVQENWRRMLSTNVLDGKDILLKDLNKEGLQSARPYIIFNATHDVKFAVMEGRENRFPFEMSADFVGTIADCGTTNDCLFSEPYQGVFIPSGCRDLSPVYISHAMAISGAVSPPNIFGLRLNLLEWHFEICGEEGKKYRDKMVLSDGGHSENLGALSLMERKVPLIVISDAGHDPKRTFEDLDVLFQFADKLLGMGYRETTPKDAKEEIKKFEYFKLDKPGEKIGEIIYIKPYGYETGTGGFENYLLDFGAYNLRTYLDTIMEHAHVQFPTDKTFVNAYEYKLIFSYYLLGRYFATDILCEKGQAHNLLCKKPSK